MEITRRRLLGAAGAAGALAATGGIDALAAATRRVPLPDPATSGLDHIVVLCMENRSFDHYLGWLPGADGVQAGITYADDTGVQHATRRWPDRTGCGFTDPDHSYEGGRRQLNGGACDGFRRGVNDDYALGYYVEEDLPFLGPLVREFTTFDRWFCPFLGPTYPNRLYTHSAATDRRVNANELCTLPTIWDRLGQAGVPAAYYFHDLPVLALYGEKYLHLARRFETFYAQAATGTLPNFVYLDPSFLGEEQGGSNDDHPHADIHRGQALFSSVVHALMDSPLWPRTALVVTYDEWGGFFDHVAPPVLPDSVPDHAQAGFRVPAVVVSPFARRGHVDSTVHDHTSILKMVEWRFGLRPLSPRDAAANNLAQALDFRRPRTRFADLPAVADPGPHVCAEGVTTGMAAEEPFWHGLAASPLAGPWLSAG